MPGYLALSQVMQGIPVASVTVNAANQRQISTAAQVVDPGTSSAAGGMPAGFRLQPPSRDPESKVYVTLNASIYLCMYACDFARLILLS